MTTNIISDESPSGPFRDQDTSLIEIVLTNYVGTPKKIMRIFDSFESAAEELWCGHHIDAFEFVASEDRSRIQPNDFGILDIGFVDDNRRGEIIYDEKGRMRVDASIVRTAMTEAEELRCIIWADILAPLLEPRADGDIV